MSFRIVVDSNCDLDSNYLNQHDLFVFELYINMHQEGSSDECNIPPDVFYNALREGAMPTTSQVNVFAFKEQFLKWAEAGEKVLYIAFSSGLSGTYNSAVIARNEVLEQYPDANITIIDSLAASNGLGLLITYAVDMRDRGISISETAQFIEENKLKVTHIFTVDDLNHLYRGGRVSASAAFVGSLLQIKPLLYVDDEGLLKPYSKYRGRKKALRGLVDHMRDLCTDFNQPIMISHGDCLEDAEFVAALIKEEFNVPSVTINYVGSTIGAHSGVGTVALFFLGEQRLPRI